MELPLWLKAYRSMTLSRNVPIGTMTKQIQLVGGPFDGTYDSWETDAKGHLRFDHIEVPAPEFKVNELRRDSDVYVVSDRVQSVVAFWGELALYLMERNGKLPCR